MHVLSPNGQIDDCWVYRRSVHNQKIEAFWSQLIREWEATWQEVFRELKWNGLWQQFNPLDESLLLFVYMPILRQEIQQFRREYNIFPMWYNAVSRLPWGPPEDNYTLSEMDFGVTVGSEHIDAIWQTYLDGFDAKIYVTEEEREVFNQLLLQSLWGPEITPLNARNQYCYLRDELA